MVIRLYLESRSLTVIIIFQIAINHFKIETTKVCPIYYERPEETGRSRTKQEAQTDGHKQNSALLAGESFYFVPSFPATVFQ